MNYRHYKNQVLHVFNKKMIDACHHVWRQGYKRQKGLEYVSSVMGFDVPEWTYVDHFRAMLDIHLGSGKKI